MQRPFSMALVLCSVTCVLIGRSDDRDKEADKKPTPPDKIKLTPNDWRPPREVVFRAEVRETKECMRIENGFACGMVPGFEVMEELRGELKMKSLIGIGSQFRKGRAYNVRWGFSNHAREGIAKAVKGGYTGMWVPHGEHFSVVPNETDWTPTDVATFRARYYRRPVFLSADKKDDRHVDYSELNVERLHQGKLSVRRMYFLGPLPGLESSSTYEFRWKPSAWAKADLQSARRLGNTAIWLMPWESLDVVPGARPSN